MPLLSLKNQKEFEHVNKHGSKIYGSHFIMVRSKESIHPNITTSTSFPIPIILGMKVSRKFSKKAVIRNKAKRRIRHLVQLLVKTYGSNTNNTSIIIIPKKGFENTDFAELLKDFFKAFNQTTKKFLR